MLKTLSFSLLALSSVMAFAESYPDRTLDVNAPPLLLQSNGFTYPAQTHLESEALVHDVVFFYSNDMLDYFQNDVEQLLAYVEGAVKINNDSFRRQDIPLRRRIAGVVAIPADLVYDDKAERDERITNLRSVYFNRTYDFSFYYDTSYVVALNRYYPDIVASIGLAEVSGKYSWVSPVGLGLADRTLAHELGHNDGFIHDTESYNSYTTAERTLLAAPFARGSTCGNFDSIMKSANGNRSEGFFSSPLVSNSQGVACGVNEEADAARAYKEAIVSLIPNRQRPFTNNKPAKAASGTVALSLPSAVITEGQTLIVEVNWSGAALGDVVQLITRKATADLTDFQSTLQSVYFDGSNTTSQVSVATFQDTVFEQDEVFVVELIHPYGVSIASNATSQTVTITSDDMGNPGVINFSQNTLQLSEGENANLTLNRTNGADGQISVTVLAEAGSATADDFTPINREVVFANGELSKTINVAASADLLAEPAETLTVRLTGNSQVIGTNNSVSVTINASSAPASGGNAESNSSSGGGSSNLSALWLLVLVALRRRFANTPHGGRA
ncbi:Calx-beta domain-containing protein [Alishewanella sp. HL-SH05]|uniref:Calx-beta domain-containing protein n=1 Tax=Alishewanella sp. HL-SH05 TaxID=3461145 RepID=UPI00404241F0